MDYVIAAVAGLAFGDLCAWLKYIFIWRPFVLGRKEFTAQKLTVPQIISMAINVVVLLAVYFLRNIWPYSFEITIVCTAVALSITGRLYQMHDYKKINAPHNTDNNT